MVHKGEKIVRIKDKSGMLQDWVIVDRIVNKYNPSIITYEVELARNRAITTQIYANKVYNNNNRSYYQNSVSTGDGCNYAKAAFIGFNLPS
jgi:hypothetical protein